MKKIIILFVFALTALGVQAQETGSFFPIPGKKYVVSGWVKEASSGQPVTYTSTISIQFLDGNTPTSLPITISPTGEIIEGWQLMVGVIEIPEGLADPSLSIELNCNSLNGTDCFYDDIRFFPYDANLKSFVYDEKTERLLAELDENNYATFYEYDLEGGLIRVKKETEKGVFTIQETRSNTFKQ